MCRPVFFMLVISWLQKNAYNLIISSRLSYMTRQDVHPHSETSTVKYFTLLEVCGLCKGCRERGLKERHGGECLFTSGVNL